MEGFEIILYTTKSGKVPIDDFIDSLDGKMQAKFLMLIKLLQINGNLLREPYTKPLGDGIFELRAKQGSDISGILYFFMVGRKIILTNGFVKKTQKVPSCEIERAKKSRKDYLNRFGKEN